MALAGMPLLFVLAGILDHDSGGQVFPEYGFSESVASILINVSGCVLTFFWYRQDAAERAFKRSAAWDAGIIFATAVIVFPIYLFRSRGAKGGFIALMRLAAFVVVGMLVPYVVGLALPLLLARP